MTESITYAVVFAVLAGPLYWISKYCAEIISAIYENQAILLSSPYG